MKLFSAIFDKQDEDDRVLDELQLYFSLKINRIITEYDIHKNDFKSQIEQQIQNQESMGSGWRFDRINSMTKYFIKTTELNGWSFVKISWKPSAVWNIQNDDSYCYIWSTLAHLHCLTDSKNEQPKRKSKYRQNFDDLNIQGFDLTYWIIYSDDHKFHILNNLSKSTFKLKFIKAAYDDWRFRLNLAEINKK